jgi:hypothetical protein
MRGGSQDIYGLERVAAQADELRATILILNMLGGLFLVPCFVAVLKPGFVVRQRP